MALLEVQSAKGALSGAPTVFGLQMKQASLITVGDIPLKPCTDAHLNFANASYNS